MRNAPNPLLFIVLTIITLLGGISANLWQKSRLTEAKSEQAKVRAQLRDEQSVKVDLAMSKEELRFSSEKLNHLEEGVPSEAYIPSMLLELESIGKASGLQVTGVRPKEDKKKKVAATPTDGDQKPKPEEKKAYTEITIEVTGTGGYEAIASFVGALEKFPKIVAINTVNLSPRKSKDGEKGMTLDIVTELKAYIFTAPDRKTKTESQARGTSTNENG